MSRKFFRLRKFKLIAWFVLPLVLLLATSIFSRSSTVTAQTSGTNLNIPGWNLVFNDEFSGTSLDSTKYVKYWGKATTNGTVSWWNGGKSLIFQNGLLRLKIAKENVTQNGVTYPYTAGGFTQLTAQTYGRWVVRARFPQGAGTQGYMGLFRQDFKWPPEIDFAEVRGKLPQENVFTQHYSQNGKNVSEVFKLQNFSTTQFHEYTVIWEPGKLTWLVDGVQKFTTTQKFENAPMHLAVGDLVGNCTSFAGCPTASTVFPTYMDIDYIRIYKKA